MGGANKGRAQKESHASSGSSSSGRVPSQQHSSPSSEKRSLPGRFDGNADPRGGSAHVDWDPRDLRNISDAIGMAGWAISRGAAVHEFPKRPDKLNKEGKEIIVKLNTFPVVKLPTLKVYQYDVFIGNGSEARPLIQKVWKSPSVQAIFKDYPSTWLFDGNKLAWSLQKMEKEANMIVDLDKDEGKSSKRENKHRFLLRRTKAIDFASLDHYLGSRGKVQMNEACLEAINFLDHLLRQTPSTNYTTIKRSFFHQGGVPGRNLRGGVECFKGAYASMRLANLSPNAGLTVNVDVANGTFWRADTLLSVIKEVCDCSNDNQFKVAIQRAAKDGWEKSSLKAFLKRFRHVSVHTVIKGEKSKVQYKIDKICGFGPDGHSFQGKVGGVEKEWTVTQYWQAKHGVQLDKGLPLVKVTKKGTYLPLEVTVIDLNQRYNNKLSDVQTAEMIKVAVTPPNARWGAVENALDMLGWENDPYLQKYGVAIQRQPTKVKARVLPAPNVQFNGSVQKADRVRMGRWRIDGHKFFRAGRPLQSWGVCVVDRCVGKREAVEFAQAMMRTYVESHGGSVAPPTIKEPYIDDGKLARGGEMITDAYNHTGNHWRIKPQLIIFVLAKKDPNLYSRIKKSCECRYGFASQCLQSGHVKKKSPQYISNVLMKVNAKLGGTTAKAVSNVLEKIAPTFNKIPTMCVGADVSHPAPGTGQAVPAQPPPTNAPPGAPAPWIPPPASYAAITGSTDAECIRYCAIVDTNGCGVELLTPENVHNHFAAIARNWMQNVGRGALPQRIFYFRDGVSEGQYAQVLDHEVSRMKEALREIDPNVKPKFVVLVATKRHHVRFFPEPNQGDSNGNPLPGTLVETGITHPFEFDFYLCPHNAIKGTARPIHYHLLLNEAGVGPTELQQFIYEHSYQYMRSTTPVSLHPAVYYAHIASLRAKAHEYPNMPKKNDQGIQQPQGTQPPKDPTKPSDNSSPKTPSWIPPLMEVKNSEGFKFNMWFI